MAHRYALKYKLEFDHKEGGFTKEEILKEVEQSDSIGACDAMILVSIIREEAGISYAIVSSDGHNEGESISDLELFKAWGMIANRLATQSDLIDWQRDVCVKTSETIRDAVLTIRGLKNDE